MLDSVLASMALRSDWRASNRRFRSSSVDGISESNACSSYMASPVMGGGGGRVISGSLGRNTEKSVCSTSTLGEATSAACSHRMGAKQFESSELQR